MIHCGDALEIIPDLNEEFDYLITDPPYPVGGFSSVTHSKSQAQIIAMMESMAASVLGGVLRSIRKRPDFVAWVMCDWRTLGAYRNVMLRCGLDSQRCLIWDKEISRAGSVYMPRHEMILVGSIKGSMQRRLKSLGEKLFISADIIEFRYAPNTGYHAFSKPPALVSKFFGKMPPGSVLDPFCGSGGLLVGAKQLGNEVVGIEMVEDAAKIAERRLAEVLM